jgi:transcriptional regulator with XRE-family HTH domain
VLDDVLVRFGNRLQTARRNLGWSQAELARRANVDVRYLGEVESGTQELCLSKIKQFSEALGVGMDELLHGL